MTVYRMADLVRAHILAIAFTGYAGGIMLFARHNAALAASCALCITVSFFARRTPIEIKKAVAFFGCCAATGAGAAWGAERLRADAQLAGVDGHHVVAIVETLERAHPSGGGDATRVLLRESSGADADTLRGRTALLQLPADIAGWRAGYLERIRARVDLPAGPRNDGESGEREQLLDQGVTVMLTVHRARDAVVIGPASGWRAWWTRMRSQFAEAVESRLPALQATVLEGVLWGDRGDLPWSLRQEFSDTGTVHVLTTAGLHLGIMAALVAALLAQTPLPRPARAVLLVLCAWFYAALAGLHIPTLRAATMLTVGLVAVESGRARTASAVLAAAAFAVVLPHPLALLSPSFSMSFACVCGIALIGPALAQIGIREGDWGPQWLAELARTGISVQVALAPLQALYFNAFTPYAVAANLVVVPLVGLVMAAGAAYAACALFFTPLAWPLSNITYWAVTIMTGAVERFAALPHAHIDVPPPTNAFIALYWACLCAFAWGVHARVPRRRLTACVAGAILLLAVVYCTPGLYALCDRGLHVDAIDVGQADCILVRAPGLHAMLVDGGGKLERAGSGVVAQPIGDRVATRTVLPFLLRHWVLHLDAVVLTHPHGDHAGGLPVILARERVDTLWDSAQLYGGPAYHRALDVVRDRHITWRRAARGGSFDLGPRTHVAILAPELPLITGTSSDINNNSVVLRIQFGNTAMLMTGDAQSEAEARLLSHGGIDLRADILKVGHHGSAYSSTPEFLAAVRPKIAIISCGRHNVFGHPSPRTLLALLAVRAAVYRTDEDGGVSATSDGNTFVVKTGAVRR
ncbi:MAG: DNA internalization-related competence protein ComEC/Rec2 [Candidatus Eremiobacteraeota bacterium]|nr:DNA internalization-related competence protein ComEC/Rec2 [Candidatus Eremiobacteraeota bacterium]MBV8366438.1 DNA internalization-related competence protein ComEC/Rec2 [Candidatus Eremiobacteraeota bacterium]